MANRAIRADDYWDVRPVIDPQLAPGAERFAFAVGRQDREDDVAVTEIFVAESDGADPRRFTQRRAQSPRWSPDGRSLAYCAKVDDSMQLVVASLDGGEPNTLTDGTRTPATPTWSPDGTRIAFVRLVDDPKPESARERNAPTIVRGMRSRFDGAGNLTGKRSHIFVVDVASGDTTQLTRGDFDCTEPAWSPDGESIAFVSDRRRKRHDEFFRGDLYVVPARGGRARKLTAGLERATAPSFSPDGRRIAVLGSRSGGKFWGTHPRALVVDVDTGDVVQLGQTIDRPTVASMYGGRQLAWLDDDTLIATINERGSVVLARISTDPQAPAETLLDGDRLVVAFDLRDGVLAWVEFWLDQLPELHRARIPSRGRIRRSTAVTAINADLAERLELRPATRYTHLADDGVEIESFLIEGRGQGRRPGVIDVHGGPFGSHPLPSLRAVLLHQVLAGAGYTVMLPNPRGSTGYGEEFMQAVIGDLAGADYLDVVGAADSAIDRGQVRSDDVHIMGYSYGGFMSAWAIGHTDRFRSAVIGAPVTDFVAMVGGSDLTGFSVAIFEGTPGERAELFRERSPISHAHRATTPSFIYVQDGDLRCPPSQADQLYTMLRLHGCEVEFARYPGGSHTQAAPSQVIDITERTLAWIDHHRP
jgi:dipeptidyl aminopeptidase/acylaminoacyl peptidase